MVFRGSKFATGYKCFNRLDRFIKAQKDNTSSEQNNSVISKFECNDCTASYTGHRPRDN